LGCHIIVTANNVSAVVQTIRFYGFDNPPNRSRQQGKKWGESQVVRGLGIRFISSFCGGPHLFRPSDFLLTPRALLGLPQFEPNQLSSTNGVAAVQPKRTLILLDLPGLDCVSVARDLPSSSNFEIAPIIILSGHDPMEHKQSAMDAGCIDYLLKPVDFPRLDGILQNEIPL
jgi:CheY-like chemotaxis protein